jgi:hypothetical protein
MVFVTLSSQIPGWYSKLQQFLPQRENQLLYSPSHLRHFTLMLRTLPVCRTVLDAMRIASLQTMEKRNSSMPSATGCMTNQ